MDIFKVVEKKPQNFICVLKISFKHEGDRKIFQVNKNWENLLPKLQDIITYTLLAESKWYQMLNCIYRMVKNTRDSVWENKTDYNYIEVKYMAIAQRRGGKMKSHCFKVLYSLWSGIN